MSKRMTVLGLAGLILLLLCNQWYNIKDLTGFIINTLMLGFAIACLIFVSLAPTSWFTHPKKGKEEETEERRDR